MATPSIAMIPSGYKAGKVYSVLPSNGVGDFAFTRAGSATRINSQGLIETVASGVSRLNYPLIDGVVNGCPSHLLEPQRTNLIPYSEDFSQWDDAGTTTVLSNIANPSGGLQSYLLSADSSATNALRYDNSFSASANYSYSLFLKSGTSQEVRMQIYDGSSFFRLAVNPLNNFEVIDQSSINSYLIEDFTNGWKRISINITTSASASTGYLQIYPDRTGNLNNVYVFGAQLEAGSYATSYVPTQLAISTRVAEVCSDAGNDQVINSTEGVLFAEISALADDLTYRTISISDNTNTNNNRVLIQLSNTTNKIVGLIGSGGSTQAIFISTSYNTLESNKIAITWKLKEFKMFINGDKIGEDNLGLTPVGLSCLDFDSALAGDIFFGKVKQIQYYNTALTDAELQALTS
jgi:hypothetical protein